MSKGMKFATIFCLVALLLLIPQLGMTVPVKRKANLRGKIVDQIGQPVQGLQLDVRVASSIHSAYVDESLPLLGTLTTNQEGEFSAALPSGAYVICAEGFPESCGAASLDEPVGRSLTYLLITIDPGRKQRSPRVRQTPPPSNERSNADVEPPVGRALQLIAGPEARDCGRVRPNGDPTEATACALRAFRNHDPFYVRYDRFSPTLADGVVGFSGGGVSLFFLHDREMEFTTCSEPVQLQKTHNSKLACWVNGKWASGWSMPPAADRPHPRFELKLHWRAEKEKS